MQHRFRHLFSAAALGIALAHGGPAATQTADDGPDTLVESYRDWVVRCSAAEGEGANGTRQCEMAQEIRQRGEGGRRVLSMAVQRGTDDAAQMTLLGPFGVRLSEGLSLRIDDAEAPQVRIGFLTCVPDGCIAAAPLPPELAAALRGGSTLEAEMMALNGETVRIGLSLMGFTAAWNRLGALR